MIRKKTRWELVFFDTLVYLISALFILVIYPSAIHPLTPLHVALYAVGGWLCVELFRLGFGLYRKIWRYAGPVEYITLISSDALAAVVFLLIRPLIPNNLTFVRAASLLMGNLLGCIMIRMLYQWVYIQRGKGTRLEKASLAALKFVTGITFADEKPKSGNRIRVAIVGAGSVGAMLADELLQNPKATYQPVCFVDVDEGKVGREVYGIPVINNRDLKESLQRKEVQEVVFALPNLSAERRQEIYDIYKNLGYKIKSYDYPTLGDANRRVLHDFSIEDLLFRSAQNILTEEIRDYYRGKSILITGGGGSIGSELARQIASCAPSRLVLLDVYENGAYDIQQELLRKYPDLKIVVEIMSICDREMLAQVFKNHTPDIVLHAAAHKHVPLMERNVIEAVRNNVFGTVNLVDVCEQTGVSRLIMISTDKAVNPTNVMGATKRLCEMIILSKAAEKDSKTKYSATRFGNVLGSNGSVIPLFEKQIAAGGPVTLTDKRIIRYFMTIPEATQLVMTSGAMAGNGELYVLDMGKPVKILDLAENMIRLSGLEPGRDIQIVETGLRPGEKMYEELLVQGENLGRTENEKIFTEKDAPLSPEEIQQKLTTLQTAMQTRSNRAVKAALKEVVPTYREPAPQ